jgi:hypothetical protein
VNVVVTDTTLTDGNWCDVLNHVFHLGSRANVVVTSEAGDERLWSEVSRIDPNQISTGSRASFGHPKNGNAANLFLNLLDQTQ